MTRSTLPSQLEAERLDQTNEVGEVNPAIPLSKALQVARELQDEEWSQQPVEP